jgi:hypothetical protein
LVDLADHYWYQVNGTHANWIWKSKLLLGILRFAALNCWVYSIQTKYEVWKDFRKNLAKELVKYGAEAKKNKCSN